MSDVLLDPPPAKLLATLSTLDTTHLQRDLAHLCSTDFGERRIGTDGHDRAAAWLIARMDALGLVVEPFDFTLEIPVLALLGAPTLAIQDVSESSWQYLTHRRDFAERPASADCPLPSVGQARRWHTGADVCGAWIILDSVPSNTALQTLSRQLAEQGAIGILLPQLPSSEGYLGKRVMPVVPVVLPVISMRADIRT